MKNYIVGIVIILIIGVTYYAGFKHGSSKVEVKYLEKEKLVHDTLITKETFLKQLPTKLDTVILTDTLYKDKPIIVAHSDTLVTVDSSKIKVDYFFPPVNKFNVWADIKQRIIYRVETREIERPETFWSRFGISVQSGFGYNWLHKDMAFYTGIGIHYKIN